MNQHNLAKYAANAMPRKFFFALGLLIAASAQTAMAETQTLKATVDGKVFESDDAGITLVPVKDSFTVSAITKGFTAYPSPPGLSDMLNISCRQFDAKPRKYTADDFAYGRCSAKFAKGRSKQPFGKDEATYEVKGKSVSAKTFVEVTKVSGKVMEGRFFIEMVEEDGTKKINVAGAFKAEDRQK
jgi:hypothetical protein